mgnify:CR=1 FL=1
MRQCPPVLGLRLPRFILPHHAHRWCVGHGNRRASYGTHRAGVDFCVSGNGSEDQRQNGISVKPHPPAFPFRLVACVLQKMFLFFKLRLKGGHRLGFQWVETNRNARVTVGLRVKTNTIFLKLIIYLIFIFKRTDKVSCLIFSNNFSNS